MLKMYHQHPENGGSARFWEDTWLQSSFEESLRFCDVDPLRPLFEKYARPGSCLLEGGCGLGHYVAHQSARGVKAYGLDFARSPLVRLKASAPELPLTAGDVSALPFRDASFDVYYSGGVVEHIEAGAEPALREAWRVLRPGGLFLVSVPYFNPLRRLRLLAKHRDRERVARAEIDSDASGKGRRFWQYAYTVSEFKKLLESTGFDVLATQGYSILWGLMEVPGVVQLVHALSQRRAKAAVARPKAAAALREIRVPSGPGLLKRLLVSEDAGVPAAGISMKAMRWAFANMMMYVCVRAGCGHV